MSHPHDAILQAHLDGELAPPAMREVTRHLSLCDTCRDASTELAQLAHAFSDVIRDFDADEPAEWRAPGAAALEYATLAQMAYAPDAVDASEVRAPAPTHSVHAPRRRAHLPASTSWRWAAAALLTVTSVAAAAVVGVPLLHRHDAPAAPSAIVTSARPLVAAALRPAGAIAVAASGRGSMDVALSGAVAGSRLHITITDGAELSVNVRSDSASAEPARFRTGDARIAVQLPEALSLVEVELPATLHSARVLLDNSVVATVTDGRASPAAAIDAGDGIALAPPR